MSNEVLFIIFWRVTVILTAVIFLIFNRKIAEIRYALNKRFLGYSESIRTLRVFGYLIPIIAILIGLFI